MSIRMIAVDIGAGSGRVIFGVHDGKKLSMREEARFTHPLEKDEKGILNWNFPYIWQCVKENIQSILDREGTVDSIGVESFACDYCVYDKSGDLTAPMTSYRGYLAPTYQQEVLKIISQDRFWDICGNMPSCYTMLFQLYHQRSTNPALSQEGTVVLPLSNAINYLLCGVKCTDHTVSTVSGLVNRRTRNWDPEICRVALPNPNVLPPIYPCETVLGNCRLPCKGVPPKIVNVGMHDTAVANHMIGHLAGDQICINAGTWISIGVITDSPVITHLCRENNTMNAGLPDGRNLMCRIMMGCWYLQQLKAFWKNQGRELSYSQMIDLVRQCREKTFPIDILQGDYFNSDPDLPKLIRSWVLENYGARIETDAGILSCCYKGIAQSVAKETANLEEITGRSYHQIYMGGGATQDPILCELIQEYTGKELVLMPAESTAAGNLLIQLKALGAVQTQDEIKTLLENTQVLS